MKRSQFALAVGLAGSLLCAACLQDNVVNRSQQDAAEVDATLFAAPVRVGGDEVARVERAPGAGVDGADVWSFDRCRITTALPEGYPAPTPPEALEIKQYPRARRAEFRASMWPDMGRNVAFWPLFNHIKEREIAMTSPVEMDYSGVDGDGKIQKGPWIMSFLYREPAMGKVEEDGSVSVVDREPVLVLSLGQRGEYETERANQGLAQMREWLERAGRFEAAGAPRSLYYNGPEMRDRDKWSEVQLPIRRRTARGG